jgi:hypothetical protein
MRSVHDGAFHHATHMQRGKTGSDLRTETVTNMEANVEPGKFGTRCTFLPSLACCKRAALLDFHLNLLNGPEIYDMEKILWGFIKTG